MRVFTRLLLVSVFGVAVGGGAVAGCGPEDSPATSGTGANPAGNPGDSGGDKTAFCAKFKENARWSRDNLLQPTEQAWGAEMLSRTQALPAAPADLKDDVANMIRGYQHVADGGSMKDWNKEFADTSPVAAIFAVSGACAS